jgi:hypothetical protein
MFARHFATLRERRYVPLLACASLTALPPPPPAHFCVCSCGLSCARSAGFCTSSTLQRNERGLLDRTRLLHRRPHPLLHLPTMVVVRRLSR